MQIDKISMAIEVDGQACLVALSQDKLQILVTMAQALFDDGVIKAVKAPTSYKFCIMEDL